VSTGTEIIAGLLSRADVKEQPRNVTPLYYISAETIYSSLFAKMVERK